MTFKKKLLALVLSGSILLAMPVKEVEAGQFWADQAVENALKNGIVKGDQNANVNGHAFIKRAELVTMVNRAMGLQEKANIEGFTDLSRKDWYYDEMAKAVKANLIKGKGNKQLRAEDLIKREEAFTILARALELSEKDFKDDQIEDLEELSTWAKDPTRNLIKKGYIRGYNNKINPKKNMTRYEFMQLMDNVFKLYIDESNGYHEVEDGNIVVRKADLDLKDQLIKGDLLVGETCKELVLDNVSIEGRLLVKSDLRLIVKNSSQIEEIIVNKEDGSVEIDLAKDVLVKKIDLITGASVKISGKSPEIIDRQGSSTIEVVKEDDEEVNTGNSGKEDKEESDQEVNIDHIKKSVEIFEEEIYTPVGLFVLHEEMNQFDYWPTPAFERAFLQIKEDLVGYRKLVEEIDSSLEKKVSKEDREFLEAAKSNLETALVYGDTQFVPKGDAIIREANKTEAIKNRMREIGYKMHPHFVHTYIIEVGEVDRLLENMPNERAEAKKISYGYMRKMAEDNIDEMEAKLKVIKVAYDFYYEEDLEVRYTMIDNMKKELMRLPANIGNELYDYIKEKEDEAIEYMENKKEESDR